MGTIKQWAQDFLGITDIKEMLRMAEIDRSAWTKILVEINESSNKIAEKIERLEQAQAEGAQNEVARLVQELSPAKDFLRALAGTPTVDPSESTPVVPDLSPVGGELPPSQDAATQDAVAEAESSI